MAIEPVAKQRRFSVMGLNTFNIANTLVQD